MNFISLIKKNYNIILILAIALILRVILLFQTHQFYFDEMFSFQFSQQPWSNTLRYWLLETNPPLHMLLEKIWFYIFPANELFARLISLIFGLLSVCLIYKLSILLFNKKTATIASLLLGIYPYHIFLSIINRGYSLLIFLAILSYYEFFIIFLKNKTTQRNKILFSITNLGLLFTHLTGIFVGITQVIIILLINKAYLKNWLKINLVPILLWIMWITISFSQKMNGEIFYGSWFMNLGDKIIFLWLALQLFISGPNNNIYTAVIGLILLFIITVAVIQMTKQKNIKPEFLFLFIPTLIPIITAIFLRLWNIKFFIISLPFFIIIVSYSLGNHLTYKGTVAKWPKLSFPRRRESTLWLILGKLWIPTFAGMTENRIWRQSHKRLNYYLTGLVIILISYSSFYLLTKINISDQWDNLNGLVNQTYNPNKKQLLIYDSFIYRDLFNYYYQGQIIAKPYYNYPLEYNESIIRYNYILIKEDKDKIQQWFVKNKISNYDQIILLNFPVRSVDLPSVLAKNNFKLIKSEDEILNPGTIFMIYEK